MPALSFRPMTFLLTGFGWLTLSFLLGLAILIGLVRGTPLPLWVRLVHVHGALVGGVAQMIMGALLAFIPPLLMTGHKRGESHPILFLAINGGAAGMMVGFGLMNHQIAGVAGLLVLASFLSVATDAWRQARKSLNAPPLNLWFYALSLLSLFAGVAMGEVMALGYWREHYGQVRLAHIHLNLLGFVTLTIVGTMHNLLPTVLQTGLYSARLARLVFWLLPAGIAALIGGFASSSVKIELVGGGVLLIGVLLYGYNCVRTWMAAGQPGRASSDHLLTGTFFLVVAVGLGLLVGVNYLWDPPALPFGTLHLMAYTHMALVGFVFQTIWGALSHLIPITIAVSRVPSSKKRAPYLDRLTAIVDRWRVLQIGGLSLGTMALAVLASLTWNFPLASPWIQITAWVAFALLLGSLLLFVTKLAWVLSSQAQE